MKPNTDNATPRQWRIVPGKLSMVEPSVRIVDDSGRLVAEARAAAGPLRQAKENAALIVQAVNSFDGLLAMLKRAVDDELGDDWKRDAKSLLAKLEA